MRLSLSRGVDRVRKTGPLGVMALVLCLSITPVAVSASEDVAGSDDHPLVGRYDGSFIKAFAQKDYEELSLVTEPLPPGTRDDTVSEFSTSLAGRFTRITYEGPAERSSLEVVRNYQQALEADGFDLVMACRHDECGPASTFWSVNAAGTGMLTEWGTNTYAVLSRTTADSEVWISVFGIEFGGSGSRPLTPQVAVTVVEIDRMDTAQIQLVEADEMAQAISRDGRIAIYGITFDFDSADILPASEPQIDQLGTLLRDTPDLRVLIVGHTDGVGAFDYNLSLSQQRAASVVERLAGSFGIERARKTPAGAGMVAPVATNRTEAGRLQNRRVELVEIVN